MARKSDGTSRKNSATGVERNTLRAIGPITAALAAPSLFASLFFASPPSGFVASGYYDKVRQLFISESTGQPQFVDAHSGKGIEVADTTIRSCTVTSMTGNVNSPDHHSDSAPDGFDTN